MKVVFSFFFSSLCKNNKYSYPHNSTPGTLHLTLYNLHGTLHTLHSLWQSHQSANEMAKVFKRFNTQARLYDIDSNLIYKHNPVNFSCHSYITFNVLIKNSRIYTSNYNLKSLKRKESVDELYKFRIGNSYYINNREEPLKYKMIDGIDDVMSLKFKG